MIYTSFRQASGEIEEAQQQVLEVLRLHRVWYKEAVEVRVVSYEVEVVS